MLVDEFVEITVTRGNYKMLIDKGKKLIWMYEEKFIQEYGIEAYNNLTQIK